MIVRLPIQSLAVSAQTMRAKLTSLMLVFAILFGNVVMPIIAHAQAAQAGHVAEAVDNHEHDVLRDDDEQEPDGDQPCHAVAHHHCSAALRAELPPLATFGLSSQLKAIGVSPAKMASLSQAPPTEPPAA